MQCAAGHRVQASPTAAAFVHPQSPEPTLGLGFRVGDLGFTVWGLGFRVQGLGLRVDPKA